MMNDFIEIVDYYKNSKISKRSLEAEIARRFPASFNLSVILDDTTVLGKTNSSYVAMIIPEDVNGVIKNILVLDSNLIINKLKSEDVENIVKCAVSSIPTIDKMLFDFRRIRKGAETGLSECIGLYLNMYTKTFDTFCALDCIKVLVSEKTIIGSKISDVLLAIDNGSEGTKEIIEYISINKLLPERALFAAEELFKSINCPAVVENTDKPTENVWYAKMVSVSTGTFNPEAHTDLDPNYIPKR